MEVRDLMISYGLLCGGAGAIFELPEGRYTPREMTAPLKKNQLFACHTGCLVHAVMGWDYNETGEVDWTK